MKTSSSTESTPSATKQAICRCWKWTRRLMLLLVGLLVFYGLLILVGMIPVNRGFVQSDDGVEIFVFSGAFHSDLILPIENSVIDWRTRVSPDHFQSSAPSATHLAFGWGDKDFYINTPRWADLKVSTACDALLIPSDTVMHVSHQTRPATDQETRGVRISIAQYEKLVEFIIDSFETNKAGEIQLIRGESYGETDAFYRGKGYYHCFRTCNCWVGEGLQQAGIKTGWFTPLPKTVFFYFPE